MIKSSSDGLSLAARIGPNPTESNGIIPVQRLVKSFKYFRNGKSFLNKIGLKWYA